MSAIIIYSTHLIFAIIFAIIFFVVLIDGLKTKREGIYVASIGSFLIVSYFFWGWFHYFSIDDNIKKVQELPIAKENYKVYTEIRSKNVFYLYIADSKLQTLFKEKDKEFSVFKHKEEVKSFGAFLKVSFSKVGFFLIGAVAATLLFKTMSQFFKIIRRSTRYCYHLKACKTSKL